MEKRLILLVLISIFLINGIYALGLSPGKVETNFVPNQEFFINYRVLGVDSDQKLIIYPDGELSEYVTIDKTSVIGPGEFTVTVKLPDKVDKPGPNFLYIKVLEDIPEGGGISTRLQVGALVVIYVPYPGSYAEINKFEINDANINEPVIFTVGVSSLGDNDIDANVKIDVHSDEGIVDSFDLGTKKILKQSSEIFIRKVEKGFLAGNYNATLKVNYGIIIKQIKAFRIGSLNVEILNSSDKFIEGKINEFKIDIESKWNNKIRNIFAEVNITKNNEEVDFFKTPSVELEPWEKKTLEGFFNAENAEPGKYKAKVILNYEGIKSEKEFDIRVVRKSNNIYYFIAGVILLIAIVLAYLFFKRKRKKKK